MKLRGRIFEGFPGCIIHSPMADWQLHRSGLLIERYPRLLLPWAFFIPGAALAAEDHIPALHPPRPELRPGFLSQYGPWLAIVAIVVVATIAFWLRWRQRPKPILVTPPDLLARSALKALSGQTEELGLVVEVSRILRHYVIEAFGLGPDELTTSELQQALQTPALPGTRGVASPEFVAQLIGFLRRCDQWKFAPVTSASASGVGVQGSGLVAAALNLIDKSEAEKKASGKTLETQSKPITVPQQ